MSGTKKADKKRQPTSPLDQSDFKKYKSHTSDWETEMAEPGPHIQLGDAELKRISELLRSSFDHQVSEMTASIVDGVLGGLRTKVTELENENTSLKSRIQLLEDKLDRSEQYSRRNCLRLSGIPETANESVDEKIMEVLNTLDAEVTLDNIDRAHRVGKPKGGSHRDIIIKFSTYRSRRKIMINKKQLKTQGKRIYINEDLTRTRSDIFYRARSLVKSKKVQNTWTADGTIIIKDNSLKLHRIETHADLEKLATDLDIVAT